jgi:hypothetical protein
MATPGQIGTECRRVLAEIKSGVSKARVRELQREYAKLSRQYSAAVRADWAQAPLGPCA